MNRASIVALAAIAVTLGAPGAPAQDHHHAVPEAAPLSAGQEAFGTIQEIVALLEADPGTDWSKVDLEALRQHLVDMDEVTLAAAAVAAPLPDGVDIAVTGHGRTLEAIRRMLPAHVRELDRIEGWTARTEDLPDGVRLIVTASDPTVIAKLRGLGFIGLMVVGSHHPQHHLAIARGMPMH
jgi:hypothetical protein